MKICPHRECPAHGHPQPPENFYKKASRADGLSGWCKRCHVRNGAAAQKRYRASEHGQSKEREWRDARNADGRQSKAGKKYNASKNGSTVRQAWKQSVAGKASSARYRANHREACHARTDAWLCSAAGQASRRRYIRTHQLHLKARMAANVAVRCGRLPKPSTCQCVECGKPAQQYHHHLGYAEKHWLDVQAVCRRCHGNR